MNTDNLPEINVGKRKEKKGGFLGFLRGGASAGSPVAGSLGGSSSFSLGSMLAGKITTLITIALVGGAGVTYMVRNAPPAPAVSSGASASASLQQQEYVPEIERHEAANKNTSSLDMFTETNKGSGLALQADPNAAAKKEAAAKDGETADAAAPGGNGGGEEGSADPQAMAQDMAQAQIGGASSLTSSLGGGNSGSNRMNFGNKFGQNAGGKASMAQLGTGFQAMPKFQERKGKILSMKTASRPVFTSGKGGKANKFSDGSKSWNQARGMLAKQQSYSGSNANQARSNQDDAWEGTTGTGDAADAAGLGDGAEVMTSPSLDNVKGNTSSADTGAGTYSYSGEDKEKVDVSPWADDASNAQKYIGYSIAASLVAAGLFWLAGKFTGVLEWIGTIIRVIATIVAGLAVVLGGVGLVYAQKVMWGAGYSGQTLMGGIYSIGGVAAMAYGAKVIVDGWAHSDSGLIKSMAKMLDFNATYALLAASLCTGLAGMLGK